MNKLLLVVLILLFLPLGIFTVSKLNTPNLQDPKVTDTSKNETKYDESTIAVVSFNKIYLLDQGRTDGPLVTLDQIDQKNSNFPLWGLLHLVPSEKPQYIFWVNNGFYKYEIGTKQTSFTPLDEAENNSNIEIYSVKNELVYYIHKSPAKDTLYKYDLLTGTKQTVYSGNLGSKTIDLSTDEKFLLVTPTFGGLVNKWDKYKETPIQLIDLANNTTRNITTEKDLDHAMSQMTFLTRSPRTSHLEGGYRNSKTQQRVDVSTIVTPQNDYDINKFGPTDMVTNFTDPFYISSLTSSDLWDREPLNSF